MGSYSRLLLFITSLTPNLPLVPVSFTRHLLTISSPNFSDGLFKENPAMSSIFCSCHLLSIWSLPSSVLFILYAVKDKILSKRIRSCFPLCSEITPLLLWCPVRLAQSGPAVPYSLISCLSCFPYLCITRSGL